MSQLPLAVVVLAAGKGTRMKSPVPKVLHPLANKPMIGHALDAVAALKPEGGIVVLSKGQDAVAEFVAPWRTVIQDPPLGTAHAVLAAREFLAGFEGDVLDRLCR
jgi:bifunctional UDP-N-acetylglucosamine pyrophosphorylase/glucosamine-1-phosphate N-acetyltransferase